MPRAPEQRGQSVVPEAILKELRELDASLTASSRLDGRRRATLPLSAPALPAPLPPHAIEPGLPSLEAHVRPQAATGKTATKWLRAAGRVPGRIYSLPPRPFAAEQQQQQQEEEGRAGSGAGASGSGNGGAVGWRTGELLLHLDEREVAKMVHAFGRNGCTARVLQVNVRAPTPGADASAAAPEASTSAASAAAPGSAGGGEGALLGSVRVKPMRVYMNAATQRIEGLDLLYCPQDRVVMVDVPVRLVNDDLAPGVRKGGWMAMSKRTVRYKALGSNIPPYIEVNVRHMELEQELLVRELPIPPGTKLYEKDYNAIVLRCTTDVGKD